MEGQSIPLLTPYKMGNFQLSHRVVMAPMTRFRCDNTIPESNAALYYSQRATEGGFLIAEAACISPPPQGFKSAPGIWSKEHIEAWKPIVNAVHAKGSIFFCQLLYPGKPTQAIVEGTMAWRSVFLKPHKLSSDEISQVLNDFKMASRNAMEAGFDGVEIHGAHGLLIDRILNQSNDGGTNEYGNSYENRCRFALQVVETVTNEIGPEKVGIRFSPFAKYHETEDVDPNPEALGVYIAKSLNKYGILYCHMVQPDNIDGYDSLGPMKQAFNGTFIAAGGYNKDDGNEAISEKHADLIAYGRLFLANPDLPKKFELGAPLNKHDRATLYTNDPVIGYTDYPFLAETVA
ncbi:12-oxophytodienoate reductase 2-like [Rutidosis leptorrhynchoides]|uniref:12-oxophytodienoate reductase 2-like n=1 Tax=Rutidosis leptorrhynchoides TaxID=125765 RepID=UPI003A9A0BD8